MSRAVLSIGSNIGDREAHLRSVVEALGRRAVAVSAVYSTAPWGGVEQQDFLNAVIVAEDAAFAPDDWLRFGRECEAAAERVRLERWGPRSLDLDIVDYRGLVRHWRGGHAKFDRAGPRPLILPHPLVHERPFVLKPLLDIAPSWRHPTLGLSARELWRRISGRGQGRVLKRI